MGVASLSCYPPDTDSARYHLETAKDMMDKLLEECSLEGEVRASSARYFPFLISCFASRSHMCTVLVL